MQFEPTRLYRVKDIAERWVCHPATVYRLIEAGELTALRISLKGKAGLRVRGDALADYEQRAATATATPTQAGPVWANLTTAQADGQACVTCGVDFATITGTQVPVGRSVTGAQVFACVAHENRAAEAERRLSLIVREA